MTPKRTPLRADNGEEPKWRITSPTEIHNRNGNVRIGILVGAAPRDRDALTQRMIEHVVLCLNVHEELVKAGKVVTEIYSSIASASDYYQLYAAVEMLKKAIAKAEGKE